MQRKLPRSNAARPPMYPIERAKRFAALDGRPRILGDDRDARGNCGPPVLDRSHEVAQQIQPDLTDGGLGLPCGMATTSTTPGTALAAAASNDIKALPNFGGRAITAVSMPGRLTSIA